MSTRTIADRYDLEQKIGSGGMGTVWRANDRVLDRSVAVKLLHEGLAEDAAFSERFRREARAVAGLGHPNIVAVYDTGQDDGVPFIVMEYIDGDSLQRILQKEGPLPVEDTARIGRSILGALGHAHSRGLVHRDMKPANVLFDSASNHVKVVDFGIAKGLEDTGGLTRTSGLIGTAAYLSPEQVSGREAGFGSDLYAAGCLLYACLAGEPPFGGSTPVAIAMRHLHDPVPSLSRRRPDVPPDFEAVIMHSLEKDPSRRFTSAAQMDAAIAATGLDRQDATEPVLGAVAPAATTVAMRQHPVGTVAGTEVVGRQTARGSSGARWLPALTAFLLVAAIAAVLVLYLQSRTDPIVETPLLPAATSTPQPPPSAAPQTQAPTPSPTLTPTLTPQTPSPPRTPLPLPGVGRQRTPRETRRPSGVTPTPTIEPEA